MMEETVTSLRTIEWYCFYETALCTLLCYCIRSAEKCTQDLLNSCCIKFIELFTFTNDKSAISFDNCESTILCLFVTFSVHFREAPRISASNFVSFLTYRLEPHHSLTSTIYYYRIQSHLRLKFNSHLIKENAKAYRELIVE